MLNIHEHLHGHILCTLLLWHCLARSLYLTPTLVLVTATCLASPEMAKSFTVYTMKLTSLEAPRNTDFRWHGKVSSLLCCLGLKCGFRKARPRRDWIHSKAVPSGQMLDIFYEKMSKMKQSESNLI